MIVGVHVSSHSRPRRRRRPVPAPQRGLRPIVALLAVAAIAGGCSSGSGASDGSVASVQSTASGASTSADAPPGGATVVADGFDGPTQIVDGPPGTLLVAQLAGEEEAKTGEVVAVDLATNSRTVLVNGLDKPTGVLWQDGRLWVMVRRGLISAAWAGPDAEVGPVEVALGDLPYNGRSEGTLTGLSDGRLLYDTSGDLDGTGEIVAGSGTLWVYDPQGSTSTPAAFGVKNAYGHAVLTDGRILVTDVGDNIASPPVEELNVIPQLGPKAEPADSPVDLGWPQCPGDQQCTGVVTPLATFAKSSTPTGVAVIGSTAYVALFVTGQVVAVPLDASETAGSGAGGSIASLPTPGTTVLDGLQGPHTLLARPDGSLWISEHLTGRILSWRP